MCVSVCICVFECVCVYLCVRLCLRVCVKVLVDGMLRVRVTIYIRVVKISNYIKTLKLGMTDMKSSK